MEKVLYDKVNKRISKHWFVDNEGNFYINCDPYGVQMSGKVTVIPINMSNYEVRQASQPIKPKMSLQECKEIVAKKYEFLEFSEIVRDELYKIHGELLGYEDFYDEAAELYASQPINSELTQLKAENERLKADIQKLQFMIDNGLGWKDMENDNH